MRRDFEGGGISRCSEISRKSVHLTTGPLKEYMATCYGINVESVLNSSTYFHVVDGLHPDNMHDVLEDALPYEIKQMIAYYFQNGYFNLKEVKKRLEVFNYGTDSSDKPFTLSAASLLFRCTPQAIRYTTQLLLHV